MTTNDHTAIKHTPGPWTWGFEEGYGYNELKSANRSVLSMELDWSLEPGEGLDGKYIKVSEADANLLAAAPELLNALKQMVHDDFSNDESGLALRRLIISNAIAVINKATGNDH